MSTLQRYEWDPKTEIAAFTREGRGVTWTETRHQPLRTPTPEEAAAGYVASLLFYLNTQVTR